MRWLSWLCWSLTAGLAAWAAVRLLGLERGYPLVPLLAFTPYVLLAGVAVLVVDVAARRWRAGAVALVAVLVLGGGVVPRAAGDGDGATAAPRLRVMTANLHFGQVPARRVVDLVRRQDVDILCVQELPAALAARLERAGLRRVLPHAVLEPRSGGAGSGIYARIPLRPRALIPGTSFAWTAAEARWRDRRFELACVHPPPPTEHRIAEWTREMRLLPRPSDDGSRILAGDFNATLDHEAMRDVIDAGYTDAAAAVGAGWRPTWPHGRRLPPGVTIDHVLAGDAWTPHEVRLFSMPGSDHRAVLAELSAR